MPKKEWTKEEIEELKKKHSDINVPDEDVINEKSFKKGLKSVVRTDKSNDKQ